jgi:5-methylcytosine-specific restriction endonuclease McrA
MVQGTRVCYPCGIPLDNTDVRRKYCSGRCKEWARLHPGMKRYSTEDRKCLYIGCRKSLNHRRIDVSFCDQLCYARFIFGRPAVPLSLVCECSTVFTPCNLRQHFCSKPCSQRAAGRKWRAKNPVYVRQVQHFRRLQITSHPDSVKVTYRDWQKLCRRYRGCCAYCGKATPSPHMDHVVPINKGGRHGIGNILPACLKCNISKHDKLLVVWRHAHFVYGAFVVTPALRWG